MRDLLRVGGVVVLLGALILTGRSWSDTEKPAPKPKTRIGVVNLAFVVKNYEKFPLFQQEIQEAAKPFQEKDAKYKKEAEELTREAQDPQTTPARRAAIEKKLKTLQRKAEDNKSEAQQALARKQERQLKALYEDVEAATRRYATARGLELVLHYNDAITQADLKSPQNITGKMQQRGCMPLYSAPGIDISKEIVAALNKDLRRKEL
jgi:outer membrane protein